VSGTIALTGPTTTPGQPVLNAPAVNAAVNAALATNYAATVAETARATAAEALLAPKAAPALTGAATLAGSAIQSAATLLAPPPIGTTTPAAGKFTTLATTGLISPTSTIGVAGTVTNDNVATGSVGEFVSSAIAAGSAVALTTATPANVTSISLTAGDWDVRGTVAFTPAATTSITAAQGGINTTTAALPAATTVALFQQFMAATVPGAVNPSFSTGTTRLSLATTTTVYLVAQSSFTVAAMGAFGFLGARRAR